MCNFGIGRWGKNLPHQLRLEVRRICCLTFDFYIGLSFYFIFSDLGFDFSIGIIYNNKIKFDGKFGAR